jgi:ABC-type phosphate transport system auxiliary subunit
MHLKKKNWDVANIASQLRDLSNQCASPYNDGFTAFELKKDLYQIKDLVDQALNRAPNFGELEQQWLTTQEQKRIIKILKS